MSVFGHWYVLLILAVIALLVFGPSRLPELGASLGRALREFRKATAEMSENLKEEVGRPVEPTGGGAPSSSPASAPPEAPKG